MSETWKTELANKFVQVGRDYLDAPADRPFNWGSRLADALREKPAPSPELHVGQVVEVDTSDFKGRGTITCLQRPEMVFGVRVQPEGDRIHRWVRRSDCKPVPDAPAAPTSPDPDNGSNTPSEGQIAPPAPATQAGDVPEAECYICESTPCRCVPRDKWPTALRLASIDGGSCRVSNAQLIANTLRDKYAEIARKDAEIERLREAGKVLHDAIGDVLKDEECECNPDPSDGPCPMCRIRYEIDAFVAALKGASHEA